MNGIPSRVDKPWVKTALVLIFLAAILWAARYWHFMQFGLYEDDLTIIPKVMAMSGRQVLDLLLDHLVALYPHGRPLSNSFPYTFTFLGGGKNLSNLYLIGFTIVSINVFLFYGLLRRLFDQSFALIGGIAFALFSADTTQAFLTHSLAVHPSLMFLLLGLHSYLSGKRLLTYIFGALILFTYETPYFLLLAAPLLSLRWDKKLLKQLLFNSLILILIVVGVYALRSTTDNSRILNATFLDLIITAGSHMIEGPIVAMGTYLYRPVQAILAMSAEVIAAILVAFILFNVVVYRFLPQGWEAVRDIVQSFRRKGFPSLRETLRKRSLPIELPDKLKELLKLALIGALLLVLAYPLTFTIRAYAISGRDTRVHFAGVVGAAMLWACAGWLVLAIAESFGRRRLAVAFLSGWFALLVGYGFVVQRDYVDAWRYQQEFWSELVGIIPDAGEGTVILVEPTGLKTTRQIGANTWNLPRVLDQIYSYPPDWAQPPRVYLLTDDWQENLVTSDGQFALNAATILAPEILYRLVPSSDVIIIETASGRLSRRMEPLVLQGQAFVLYENPADIKVYEKNILYQFLIASP